MQEKSMILYSTMLQYLICPICHDTLKDPITTLCGHVFCMSCFQKSMEKKQVGECIICKKTIPLRYCVSFVMREIITMMGEIKGIIIEKEREKEREINKEYLFLRINYSTIVELLKYMEQKWNTKEDMCTSFEIIQIQEEKKEVKKIKYYLRELYGKNNCGEKCSSSPFLFSENNLNSSYNQNIINEIISSSHHFYCLLINRKFCVYDEDFYEYFSLYLIYSYSRSNKVTLKGELIEKLKEKQKEKLKRKFVKFLSLI